MAERTGIPHIDALIESFLTETIKGCSDDVHYGKEILVADLAYDPTLGPGEQPSSGWCGAATRAFGFHLGYGGVRSHNTDDDITGHFTCHGYDDLPYGPLDEYGDPEDERLSPSHCANMVFDGDYMFMIDWTAAQYGYESCPYVRRIDRETGWQLAHFGNEIDHSKWQTQWETEQAA